MAADQQCKYLQTTPTHTDTHTHIDTQTDEHTMLQSADAIMDWLKTKNMQLVSLRMAVKILNG